MSARALWQDLLIAVFLLASSWQAQAVQWALTSAGPPTWTYTLTFDPLDNCNIFVAPAKITMTGMTGVTAAGTPTGSDFPATHDTGNRNWTGVVSGGGTTVTWTNPTCGTGNFTSPKHVTGFTVIAAAATNGSASFSTTGMAKDTGVANSIDITGSVDGPTGSSTPLSNPPPVIGVNASSNITSTTVNVTATIQPRVQDVGTTSSIFVFVQAPSNLVLGTAQLDRSPASPPIPAATDDAIVCVLAQVNANGQVVAVSASTMQAYVTGVLAAQSQSLNLLSNVPTANVAGASVFVGYGSSAAAMLSSGTFQTAVSVPGAIQCTARTDSAPAANLPGSISGLWWNENESGWGLHLTQRGSNKFAAWYTYDGAGKPKWYVSTCAGASGTTGTCSGTLYEVTGPNFFGGSFDPSLVNAVNAGTLSVNFQTATNASMTYTGVAGLTRTVALTRQPLGAGTAQPAGDYTDIWWGGASQSGWGMAMAQQFGVTFIAWYAYDAHGKPTWLVATCAMNGSSCSGTLYRTTGPPFGPTFNAALVQATSAGTVVVSFIDANNAVISYTVDGVSATKVVTRQVF